MSPLPTVCLNMSMWISFSKKFNQLKTDQSAASLLRLCNTLCTLQGEGHKCSQVDVGKYKLIFCFPR